MKKFKSIVVLMLCLISVFFLVGCKDKPPTSTEGLVYAVSFETGIEGVEIESQAVEAGKLVEEPALGLRAGYVLVGWKKGDEWWNFKSNKVNENTTLVAVWEKDNENWDYTDGLSFEYDSGTEAYYVSGYTGTDSEVVVPLYFDGKNGIKVVSKIGDFAFKDNSVIRKIDTGKGVSVIGNSAFAGSSITEFVVSETIEKIRQSAFEDTQDLLSITFEAGEKKLEIDRFAFESSGLEAIIFPDRLYSIGNSAFSGSSLKVALFGRGSKINSIGNYAFRATGITNIDLPNSLKTLGEYAFSNCVELQTIVVSSGLTMVGNYCLEGCDDLKGVYYTSSKPQACLNNPDWMGGQYLEFDYSLTPVKGYWHYSSSGVPVLHSSFVEVCVNAENISTIFSAGQDFSDFSLVVRFYTEFKPGVYNSNTKIVEIDEEGSAVFIFDKFASDTYVLELHSGEVGNSPSEFNAWVISGAISSSEQNLVVTNVLLGERSMVVEASE